MLRKENKKLLTTCGLMVFTISLLTVTSESNEIKNNWHHWRGPEANGVARTANPPLKWSEMKNIKWKMPIEGQGTSTPIIWGNKVFLLTCVDTGIVDPKLPKPEDQPKRVFGITYPNTLREFVVLCLNRKTGEKIWGKTATKGIPHEGHHGDNDFASASPTTDGKRLYCWFGSAGLFVYDLNGNKLWDRNLGKVFMEASLGEGCSPVVHNDRVIIVRDQRKQSYIEVLDAKTGDTVWKKEREEPGAWATPLVVEHSGKTQVITSAANKVRSYDLKNGDIIWECGGLSSNAIPSPVRDKDLVYCMSGYKGYSALALPLSAKGDITGSKKIAWSLNRGTPYIPSPVLYDGLLYFNQSNRAIFTCVDSQSGKIVMERTRIPGLQNVYASPVGAKDRVYITGRNGKTVVLKKGKKLEVLAENQLDDTFDASAAIVGNQIFLRGKTWLYCIQDKSAKN